MFPRALTVTLALAFTAWSALPAMARVECRGSRVVVAPSCSHCLKAKGASKASQIRGQCCFIHQAESKQPVLTEKSMGSAPDLTGVVAVVAMMPLARSAAGQVEPSRRPVPRPLQRRYPLLN